MTQTEEGALIPEDIERLRTGSVQLLKNDDMGRSVVYLRRALWNRTPGDLRLGGAV
jgi:hypothetical protein